MSWQNEFQQNTDDDSNKSADLKNGDSWKFLTLAESFFGFVF